MMFKKIFLDIEIYRNYFLLCYVEEGQEAKFIEIMGEDEKANDADKGIISYILQNRMVGFNIKYFDLPLLLNALEGRDVKYIFEKSQDIIKNGPDHLHYHCLTARYIFDDLLPLLGKHNGLKTYGVRAGFHNIQDLPYDINTVITKDEADKLKKYCENDVRMTMALYPHVEEKIAFRQELSKLYRISFQNADEPKIAENILKEMLSVYRQPAHTLKAVKYTAPPYIVFKNEYLQDSLEKLQAHVFNYHIGSGGNVTFKEPDFLKTPITINGNKYKFGIGGLHSKEKNRGIIAKENEILIDCDVESYYPNIIINSKLSPEHIGVDFLQVYKTIVKKRLKAKQEGDKLVSTALKIVINSTFGKFKNKYSIIFSPHCFLHVTLTGQLTLLLLIKRLEAAGIKVVSANTDGIISFINKKDYGKYIEICRQWELDTSFKLAYTNYKALYSESVNTYIAHKEDNTFKIKGRLTEGSLDNNGIPKIFNTAIGNYLKNGTPIDYTIKNCAEIRDFLFKRKVTGGAVLKETSEYLGSVIRWYYTTDNKSTIVYKKNGNKVPKAIECRALLKIEEFPKDIDYDKYISETKDIMRLIGIN